MTITPTRKIYSYRLVMNYETLKLCIFILSDMPTKVLAVVFGIFIAVFAGTEIGIYKSRSISEFNKYDKISTCR
jgi:hypothetical protein